MALLICSIGACRNHEHGLPLSMLGHFNVQERTAEPWILHDFGRDFYGEQLRLVVAAYIRPEADFTSLDALIARIHADADVARAALDMMPLASLASDQFLQPTETDSANVEMPAAHLRT